MVGRWSADHLFTVQLVHDYRMRRPHVTNDSLFSSDASVCCPSEVEALYDVYKQQMSEIEERDAMLLAREEDSQSSLTGSTGSLHRVSGVGLWISLSYLFDPPLSALVIRGVKVTIQSI